MTCKYQRRGLSNCLLELTWFRPSCSAEKSSEWDTTAADSTAGRASTDCSAPRTQRVSDFTVLSLSSLKYTIVSSRVEPVATMPNNAAAAPVSTFRTLSTLP
jgi:hypothetical protein